MGTWAHRCSKERIGMLGRGRPASHPASHPTISTTTLPCDRDDVPTPTGVPGLAVAGTRTAAPAGRWDDVGGAGREGRRAQEGMGEDRGRREEAAGEGGKGHGSSGQGGGAEVGGARQAARRGGAGSGVAAAGVGGPLEKAGEGGEGGTGTQTTRGGRGAGGSPPTDAIQATGYPAGQESEMQERAWRRIRGEAGRLEERDREMAARERRVQEEKEAVARGHTGSSRTQKGISPPRMWRGGCRPGKGPEMRKRRLGRRGGSGAGWRGGEQGEQRGRRGLRAPAQT